MPPNTPSFATDKQRLAQAGRNRPLRLPPVGDDKVRLNRLARAPKAPVALPVTPKPLVVTESTFLIRGKDDTYLGFAFGDGRQVSQVNLHDYLPADRVPHLGNYVLSLTGILPDAVGIDIGASIGASAGAGLVGFNILWHTRGERTTYPELHVYYGGSLSLSSGTVFRSLLTPPNASASVQVLLAWANHYDKNGRNRPSSNGWVANGFNWTGTFWSAGFSVPVPPRFTLVGSYFKSIPFSYRPRDTDVWVGVSLGIGVSGKFKVQSPFIKMDVTKLLDFRKLDLALNHSQTEYGLVYGNGGDFIPQRGNQDISGWNVLHPINQNDYPTK